MKAGVQSVGNALVGKDEYHLVVVKSTVIPGTTEDVLTSILENASSGWEGDDFGTASNPEFLREGSAVEDFIDPDKIVFGTDGDERALDRLRRIYESIITEQDVPAVETGRRRPRLSNTRTTPSSRRK
jgi:UDPglucose 6-dehydrogenase